MAYNRIRSLREETGMTQKELAARLGVCGGAMISKYESGRLGLTEETIRKLSGIFGVSTDYLLGLSDDRGSGTSLARPSLNWNALRLVEGADALSAENRRVLFLCVQNAEFLDIARQYIGLTDKSRRRLVEYMEMLQMAEKKAAADGSAANE